MRRWLAVLGAAVPAGAGTTVALAASGTTIVVSPSGDDSAPGTSAKPVWSLSRARDPARAASHPVSVQFTDGTFRLTAPLVLDARDSGVTWSAAPGSHPVVSGGVRVTGWTLTDSARHLWSAPLSVNTRQPAVDGRRAVRAVPVRLTSEAPRRSTGTA
jgi:hypothetical protein